MALNDVLQATVEMRVAGEYCANVLHYREAVGSTDDVPAKSLAEAIVATIIPDWAALISEQVIFACCYVRRIRPTPGITYTALLTTPGEVVSEAIPSSSALVVSLASEVATKRGRGRIYFAGLPESSQAGGSLEGTVVAGWEALAALLIDPLVATGGNTGEWQLGVYSRSAVEINDALVTVVRSNLAQQRGRRQRPGTS